MVEHHYDFVSVHAHSSSRELEKILKDLGQDDSNSVEFRDKINLDLNNVNCRKV